MNLENIIFYWRKWNKPIGNLTVFLVKKPGRYIFLAYVYKSIALVNQIKRIKC